MSGQARPGPARRGRKTKAATPAACAKPPFPEQFSPVTHKKEEEIMSVNTPQVDCFGGGWLETCVLTRPHLSTSGGEGAHWTGVGWHGGQGSAGEELRQHGLGGEVEDIADQCDEQVQPHQDLVGRRQGRAAGGGGGTKLGGSCDALGLGGVEKGRVGKPPKINPLEKKQNKNCP